MNNDVVGEFNEYFRLTGNVIAATNLTLTAALRECCPGPPPAAPEDRRPASPNQPMTVPEVAKFLRVKPQTVLCWVHSGDLMAANVAPRSGGQPRYRVAPADLAAFQRQRGATTRSDAPRRAIRRGRPFAQPRHPTT
jgi:hypothetical protein